MDTDLNKNNERIMLWDNMKGILIFLVVFAHFMYSIEGNSVTSTIVDAVYMFHMPAFIFISGYFSKSESSRSAKSILKLLFTYIVFNGLFILFFALLKRDVAITSPYYSYWYILALIIWRLMAKGLSKIKHILILLVALSLISGLWYDVDNTFALARVISFSPYFMAGYIINTDEISKRFYNKNSKTVISGIAAAAIAFAIGAAMYIFIGCTQSNLLMESYTSVMDIPVRALLFVVVIYAVYALLAFSPNKKIPLLSKMGKNSLYIFLIHRIITITCTDYISRFPTAQIIIISFVASILVSAVFGSNLVSGIINRFITYGTDIICGEKFTGKKAFIYKIICVEMAAVIAIAPVVSKTAFTKVPQSVENLIDHENSTNGNVNSEIYNKISAEKQQKFDNAFKIVFSGDLLLLEDQVKNAYNGIDYDFSNVFEYAEKYISSADLAIGVLEGPLAGEEVGYSSSNYDDGKELYLNFPDEFAVAAKNAGYDLVTTANNHLLDKGVEGALRTMDTLNSIGLDYTGSYRSAEEKENERIKIIEAGGMKFAVLSYTFGCNYYTEEDLFNGDLSYVTSVLTEPGSKNFKAIKESVAADFENAKTYNPDFIVVLPHMGTQFTDEPDNYQRKWCDYFKSLGADIILGDHTHSVQPANITTENGKTVFTEYCPGNFANIYREYNGDACALVEVYIDKDSREIIGGAIVPMWIESSVDGNYRPLPIYDILNDEKLKNSLSTYDLDRIEEVNKHISKIMLGKALPLDMVREKYLFDETGFMRTDAEPLEITSDMKKSDIYNKLVNAKSVCFLGDSVTEGTRNGGYGWYEPLESIIKGNVYNCSWGGGTVRTLIENIDEINKNKAELYVVAIGTNDVRYRDKNMGAITKEDYIEEIIELQNLITAENPEAEFVYIAPWTSTDGDNISKLKYSEKIALNNEYSNALKVFCEENGHTYVNANGYIDSVLNLYPRSDYLLDHIHPNSTTGLRLYSEAVLLSR